MKSLKMEIDFDWRADMVKLKIVELFAGAGGLGYGFARNNNFEIVAANEILPNLF